MELQPGSRDVSSNPYGSTMAMTMVEIPGQYFSSDNFDKDLRIFSVEF